MNLSILDKFADVKVMCVDFLLQSRKKKGGKDEASKGAEPTSVSTKNLQQILSKMSIEHEEDDTTKKHKFWDTQPVPKLGEGK